MADLFASAALGTEDLVGKELRALGFRGVAYGPGGARFRAEDGSELTTAMRACLHARAAMRILWPLAEYPCENGEALYEGAAAAPWERFVTPTSTFAVNATTSAAPPLAHAPFLAQRVKDAVVDRLRERSGQRPDVRRDDPDVRLYVHVAPRDRRGGPVMATVGVDVSGDSLHLRGYRVSRTEAPLRETLAAAIVLATGWRGETPFLDPMCGSGTIAIEAAMVAADIAPGLGNPGRFGFLRWPSFGDGERTTWTRLLEEARTRVRARTPFPIYASDHDDAAVAAARVNVAGAHPVVAASVDVRQADARTVGPLEPPGVIVSNPPYGERIGRGGGLEAFYRTFGGHLRTLAGHTAFLLVPPEGARLLGMRPSWERRLRNGPIAVTLCRFELGGRSRTR